MVIKRAGKTNHIEVAKAPFSLELFMMIGHTSQKPRFEKYTVESLNWSDLKDL